MDWLPYQPLVAKPFAVSFNWLQCSDRSEVSSATTTLFSVEFLLLLLQRTVLMYPMYMLDIRGLGRIFETA
jgi:hypothetical protein